MYVTLYVCPLCSNLIGYGPLKKTAFSQLLPRNYTGEEKEIQAMENSREGCYLEVGLGCCQRKHRGEGALTLGKESMNWILNMQIHDLCTIVPISISPTQGVTQHEGSTRYAGRQGSYGAFGRCIPALYLIASYLTQSDPYTMLLFKDQSQLVTKVLVHISSTLCTSLTPKQRPGLDRNKQRSHFEISYLPSIVWELPPTCPLSGNSFCHV